MTDKKRNLFFIIISVVTLILTLYILFVTVIDQIISQSQGYFYAGVFGFILLLVFLLCNLFTKLIATGSKGQNSTAWRIVSAVVLIVLGVFFVISKARYYMTIDAIDEPFYKSAISMVDKLYSQNTDLTAYDMSNPVSYVYSIVLSVFFRIFGSSSRLLIWLNILLYSVCIFFVYRIVHQLSDRLTALFSVLLCIITPSQNFAVYYYSCDSLFTLLLLAAVDIYMYLFLYKQDTVSIPHEKEKNSASVKLIVLTFIGAILTGFILFCEPVYIIILILLLITFLVMKRECALNLLVIIASGIMMFAGLNFVKSIHMDRDFGNVIASNFRLFNFRYDYYTNNKMLFSDAYNNFAKQIAVQDGNINNIYSYIVDSKGKAAYSTMSSSWLLVANQLLYMFFLIMIISCLIIALKENLENITPVYVVFIGFVLLILFEQNRNIMKYNFMTMLIVICGISLNYLYLNHHPEQRVMINALDALEKTGRENIDIKRSTNGYESILNEAEFVRRAQALIFVGTDEDLYKQIKDEEHKNAQKRDNRSLVLDDTFDDYDDDFFLDKEDDAPTPEPGINTIASPNTVVFNSVPPVNSAYENVPAWKKRPERFGEDDMFFDDEDPTDHLSNEPVIKEPEKNIPDFTGMTTNDPEPEVEKIVREDKKTPVKDSKTKKNKKEKSGKSIDKSVGKNKTDKKVVSTDKITRKVKTVGSDVRDEALEQYKKEKESRYIENPLPVPKKRDLKPIDYSIKDSAPGWDYDVDISDDDDWDV